MHSALNYMESQSAGRQKASADWIIRKMDPGVSFVGQGHLFANAIKSRRARRWRCSVSSKKDTIISWNVNSLRALLRKQPNVLKDVVHENEASVLCLQETKLRKENELEIGNVIDPGWYSVYHSSTARQGYSGTAVFCERYSANCFFNIGHPAGDSEGRASGIEQESCFIVNVYTMNSGENLRRLPQRMEWDSVFRQHIRKLRNQGKGVIVVGDLNVARSDQDVWDPEQVKNKAGFSDAERESFEDTLETCGLVDVFRERNPFANDQFTAWHYQTRARSRNNGMRIDYALVSDDLLDAVLDVRILDHVMGSDHCPIAIDLKHGAL